MTDNTATAAALQALAAAIAALQPADTSRKIYDSFESNNPFDLSTCSSCSAYDKIFSTLDNVWSGEVDNFPSFVVSLKNRAKEGKWDATRDTGTLRIAGKDFLTNYHSITDSEITTDQTACNDIQAKQNSKAMYTCIKSLIRGDVMDTIFTQFANLPDHEDRVALFKQLTTFTTVTSL